MLSPVEFGVMTGAIRVTSALPFTVPAELCIWAIVPQPSATLKAVAITGYNHYTADRTSGGGNLDILGPVYGAYQSIVVASGAVDIYLWPRSKA